MCWSIREWAAFVLPLRTKKVAEKKMAKKTAAKRTDKALARVTPQAANVFAGQDSEQVATELFAAMIASHSPLFRIHGGDRYFWPCISAQQE